MNINRKLPIMKKLILSAAFILGAFTLSAQTTPETAKQEKAQTQTEKEVKIEEAPAAVLNTVKSGFPAAKINSITVNSANEYTINVTNEGQTGLIYVDANGKWIKRD